MSRTTRLQRDAVADVLEQVALNDIASIETGAKFTAHLAPRPVDLLAQVAVERSEVLAEMFECP